MHVLWGTGDRAETPPIHLTPALALRADAVRLVPYAIVASALTTEARCYVLFCQRHKNYWMRRTLMIWAAFPLVVAIIVAAFVLLKTFARQVPPGMQDIVIGSVCVGSLVLVACWL